MFFFKQKTGYEGRISDWSSDVCSSDRPRRSRGATIQRKGRSPAMTISSDDEIAIHELCARTYLAIDGNDAGGFANCFAPDGIFVAPYGEIGRASGRERVCQSV